MQPRLIALALCLLFLLLGCSTSGKLTNGMAEQAMKRWKPSCNATVTGIQEVPQQNIATVYVTFSNFRFNRTEQVFDPQRKGFYEGPAPKTYSGPGIAVFTHYNDGRWVLTKVTTSQGPLSTHWDGLSVEVP